MVIQNGQKTTATSSCSQYSNKKVNQYTPFYLMFGRNFDSSNLLNLITSPNYPGMNSQMLTELDTSDEKIPECVDDPYDLPKDADEWIDSISSIRKNDKMTAIQNIKKNQKVQKKSYHLKLNAINITLFPFFHITLFLT